ncbi:hypothetical protein NM208_g12817 [Fusarium decemcellulare]|uniref:Uncharacterized protein n=1 Tax=Fusarium decemcellulare TaxID=57161 RepID=A0ACC1RM49_9HYPO|nr:hypothetical protein NM208_g12817 [Fusarium decemcellulare]
MCMYSRIVYSCRHERWGLRVKPCQVSEDFHAGNVSEDCTNRQPHALTSRRLERKCYKCAAVDTKLVEAKKKLDSIREMLMEKQRQERQKKKMEEGEETALADQPEEEKDGHKKDEKNDSAEQKDSAPEGGD